MANTIDTIGIFKGIATAHNSGLSALGVIKGHIETLRKSEIKIGKSKKTCAYRVQLTDAYKSAFPGKSEKTLMNYITAIADAVNNGTEFSFSASKGKGKGKSAKGKGAEKTGTEKMEHALLNVWKLSDVGENVLIEIETIMADAIPLIDAIEMVLTKAGFALDGVESAE